MPRLAFTVYLWLYFFDGTFSVLDDLLEVLSNSHFLGPWRNGLAALAFLGSLSLLPALILSPRFPKRLLLPPIFFLLWTNLCGAFPLEVPALILSGFQFLSGGLLLWFCREPGSLRPTHFALARPAFAWKSLLASAGIVALCGFLFLPVFVLSQAVSLLHTYTGGYVRLHPDGLYLAERHFQKGDRQLRLVSMMHFGRKEFYEELTASLPRQNQSVVLLEGVTNRGNLKAPQLGYEKLADTFGLTAQNESAFEETARHHLEAQSSGSKTNPVEFRNADVDLSDLRPETLAYLNLVGDLYRSNSWREFLKNYQTLNAAFEEDPTPQVLEDILYARNDHLFGIIEESLEDYPVILVPWGALHLPDIEDRARKLGFEQTYSTERKVLNFR